jgi:protein-S-isoprenylcysteine O-methyltransferase Ste14
MDHSKLLALVSAVWVGLEIFVAIVTRGTSGKDRWSFRVLWALLGAGIFTASQLKGKLPMPDRNLMFWVGIALILTGIVFRAAAIFTLRRYFTVQVTIDAQHELIDRGLYRWIRHPSYTGALISFIGLGFAFGSWLSLGIIIVVAMIGFGYRIRVEEAALVDHFGDRYRSYAERTRRLVPGIY